MKEKRISPNAQTYSYLIRAYARTDNIDEARALIASYSSEGGSILPFAYASMVSSFFKRGDVASAEGILKEMSNAGVTADFRVYNALISGYVSQNMLKEARDVLNKMGSLVVMMLQSLRTSFVQTKCVKWQFSLSHYKTNGSRTSGKHSHVL